MVEELINQNPKRMENQEKERYARNREWRLIEKKVRREYKEQFK